MLLHTMTCAATSGLLCRARFIYLAYLSIVTVLLTISARNFINT